MIKAGNWVIIVGDPQRTPRLVLFMVRSREGAPVARGAGWSEFVSNLIPTARPTDRKWPVV